MEGKNRKRNTKDTYVRERRVWADGSSDVRDATPTTFTSSTTPLSKPSLTQLLVLPSICLLSPNESSLLVSKNVSLPRSMTPKSRRAGTKGD